MGRGAALGLTVVYQVVWIETPFWLRRTDSPPGKEGKREARGGVKKAYLKPPPGFAVLPLVRGRVFGSPPR
jgi:hypothetical protein